MNVWPVEGDGGGAVVAGDDLATSVSSSAE